MLKVAIIILFLLCACGGKTFTKSEAKICDARALLSTEESNKSGYDKECNLYNGKKPDITMVDKSRTTRILLTPILLPFGIVFFSQKSFNPQIQGSCIAKGFAEFHSEQIGNTYYGWCLE